MKNFWLCIALFFSTLQMAMAQPASFEWAEMVGNPTIDDTKTSIAALGEGHYIITGEFTGQAQFGDESLISSGGTDIFLARYDAGGNLIWLLGEGGSDNDYIEDVTVDVDQNIFLAGYFYGNLNLGGQSFTSSGSQDVFIAKYDADGNFQWAQTAGGEMADYIGAVATGPDGESVIGGHFYNTMVIGGVELSSIGGSDIFMAGFGVAGELLWTHQFSGSSSDGCSDLDINMDGDIFMSGFFYGDIQVGDFFIQTDNPVGVFHCKMDPDGEVLRAGQVDGNNLDIITQIRTDLTGNYFLAGNFSDQVTFGTEEFDAGAFNLDVYLAKYTGTGTLLWASQGHSTANDDVVSLDVDNSGNAYISGHFLLDITFEDLTIPYTLCCGSREIYVIGYTSDGEVAWGKQIAGARSGMDDLCLVSENALVTSGYFTDTISFDELTLVSVGQYRNFTSCIEFESMVSVQDKVRLSGNKVQVYPNPADEYIRLQGIPEQPFTISIYSLDGSRVGWFQTDRKRPIPVGNLPPGIYSIIIQDQIGNLKSSAGFIKF